METVEIAEKINKNIEGKKLYRRSDEDRRIILK
jgi:hypothetical protein